MDTPRCGARLVVTLLFALAFVAPGLAGEPAAFAVEAEVDGTWVTVLGLEDRRLLGRGPSGPCAIPATAPLRLVGELAAHPAMVESAVRYELVEVPPPSESDRPVTWRAQNIRPLAEFVAGTPGRWQPTNPEKAALVCLWVSSGGVTQIRALPLERHPDNLFRAPSLALGLTPVEANGGPVFLLVEEGTPLPRRNVAADTPGERTALLLALGQDPAAAAEVQRAGRLAEPAKDAFAPLHLAAQAGGVRTVETLLQSGVAVKAKTVTGDTALHLAARNGRAAVVARLIAAKAPLNATNAALDTPLHLAATGAHVEVCRLLLDAGAAANPRNEADQTPAFRALVADCAPAVDLLLARKADFGLNDFIRDRLLVRKAAGGQRELVQKLLALGANPDAAWLEQTALLVASREGHDGVVADLLAAKADPNLAAAKGTTPLIAAASRGRAAVARRLLAAGARPNVARKGGYTPLHAASFAGSAATVQALLGSGAEVDAASDQGIAPLTLALGSGSRETVEALLAAGAAVVPSNPRFEAELTAALAMDADGFLAAALKAGMPVGQQTAKGWSALQLATIGRADRCSTLLRAAGATEDGSASPLVPGSQLERRPALREMHPTIDPRDPAESDFAATTVVVEALVGADGAPAFARAACDDCRLSLSAVQTVLRSRFEPALKGGVPVATQVRVPVRFRERAPQTFEAAALDVKPQPISRVAPLYPFTLKRNGITGQAVVEFVVGADGKIRDLAVVSATHDGFATAALAAVREWRFKAGILDGEAVPCRMQQAFPFRLN